MVAKREASSPNQVTVTAEEIQKIGAIDLDGIFAETPEVRVGGGSPAAQKIYVRGFEDKLLNITLDGATQPGYLSHHQSQLMVQPEFLKTVEVNAGAGAATEGPGALGGSIHLTHKGAEDFLKPGQDFGAFLKSGYLSNGNGLQEALAVYGRLSDNWNVAAGFDFIDVGGYDDGHGDEVTLTGHQQTGGYLKLDGKIADDQKLSLTYEKIHDEGLFWHRPNFNGYFNHPRAANVPVFNEADRDTLTLNYVWDPASDLIKTEATAFYNDYRIDRRDQYKMGVGSFGLDLRNTSIIATHSVTYGFDFRHDITSLKGGGSSSVFFPFPPTNAIRYQTTPDEKLDIFGLYIQDEWKITEPLLLSFGLRFDHYDFEDYQDNGFDDSHVSPNVLLSYQIIEPLTVYARYAQAFKGVTAIDTASRNEGATVNDPGTDGQTAENLDIGVRYDDGRFFGSASLFQQRIDDVIAFGATTRTNVGDLEAWGYNIEAGARFGGFTARIGVTESNPELNGNELTDISFGLGTCMGRSWNANIDYTFEAIRLSLGWSAEYVESFDDTPAGIPTKDSYFVNNLYARWQPVGSQDLILQLAVTNLFDEYYVDQATSGYNAQLGRVAGLPAQGFGVNLSASCKF